MARPIEVHAISSKDGDVVKAFLRPGSLVRLANRRGLHELKGFNGRHFRFVEPHPHKWAEQIQLAAPVNVSAACGACVERWNNDVAVPEFCLECAVMPEWIWNGAWL